MTFDKTINKQYDNFSSEFMKNHIGSNQVNREVMRDFIGKNIKDKNILDVGCGDGYDLEYYQSLEAKCYGIDSSKNLVEVARKRLPEAEIYYGLVEEMQFSDGFFDCVYSNMPL